MTLDPNLYPKLTPEQVEALVRRCQYFGLVESLLSGRPMELKWKMLDNGHEVKAWPGEGYPPGGSDGEAHKQMTLMRLKQDKLRKALENAPGQHWPWASYLLDIFKE